jgi:hypothetical protein
MAGIISCNGKKDDKGPQANTPPVITTIILEPQNPTIRTEISARIISVDKENNPISYDIKWFVNGQQIGEGMLFSYEDIKKGDRIHAEATPHDGKDWGETVRTSDIIDLRRYGLKKHDVITGSAFVDDGEFRSEPFPFEVHIANAPPVLTNQVDSIKCKPESLYYKLPIMDPDNDPLTYDLLDAPAGIMIDGANGVVYGSAGAASEFTIEVRAADNDGAYLDYRFTITSPQM